jgi:hypothetical protein
MSFPPRVNLLEMMAQQLLPQLAPDLIDPASMSGDEPTKQARIALDNLNAALAANETYGFFSQVRDHHRFRQHSLRRSRKLTFRRTTNDDERLFSYLHHLSRLCL